MKKRLQANVHDDNIRKLVLDKKASLWLLYRLEEQAWQQKSRVKWLHEGDRNTKFFHLMVSHKRNVNSINKLVIHGGEVDNPGVIKSAIADHFESHFNHYQGTKLVGWNCNFRRLREENATFLEQPVTPQIRVCDRPKANIHLYLRNLNL